MSPLELKHLTQVVQWTGGKATALNFIPVSYETFDLKFILWFGNPSLKLNSIKVRAENPGLWISYTYQMSCSNEGLCLPSSWFYMVESFKQHVAALNSTKQIYWQFKTFPVRTSDVSSQPCVYVCVCLLEDFVVWIACECVCESSDVSDDVRGECVWRREEHQFGHFTVLRHLWLLLSWGVVLLRPESHHLSVNQSIHSIQSTNQYIWNLIHTLSHHTHQDFLEVTGISLQEHFQWHTPTPEWFRVCFWGFFFTPVINLLFHCFSAL